MLGVLAGSMAVAAVVLAGLAVYVARRRGSPAGISLAVLLVAVAWWGLTYAFELTTEDLAAKNVWGQLKYAGVALVAPAWLVFVLQYTGRGQLVRKPLLTLLALEPVAVMAVLLNPATDHLVRSYPPGYDGEDLTVVETGWVFWAHLAYSNLLVLVATGLFVTTLVRISRLYWRLSVTLVVAALLPLTANALHNFAVGPFAELDLTPFVFVPSGAVLVWGLHRERLMRLAPVARSAVIETMADGVVVVDAFRRVADLNPAAARVLRTDADDAIGRPLVEVLTASHPQFVDGYLASDTVEPARVELAGVVDGAPREYDIQRQPLTDSSGRSAGELFVLRDVTESRQAQERLQELLAERTRIATALQASLLPATLPHIQGLSTSARYQPAGDGREIGGDFYDVFPLEKDEWGIVLGDVSGKGAEAAAVTALIRYTVRTLADQTHRPRDVLAAVNDALLRQGTDERYCTLAYLVVRREPWCCRVTICLGGHPQPILVRPDGSFTAVGRLGTALGLINDPDLYEVDLELAPQDVLCLFTDGLIEARRGKDQLGETRVAAVLREHRTEPPAEIARALEEAAREFRGGQLADDLAILVVAVD